MKKYSLKDLKEAFYMAFHKSGEQFFSYFGEECECEDSTFEKWVYLVECLDSKQAELERLFKH